ncbi:hypothetical protein V8C44DRAFT_334547 [Trichoderma aethiopicum]
MGASYLESNRRQSHCATLREESMPRLLCAAAHRRCCRTPSFCRLIDSRRYSHPRSSADCVL